MRLSKNIGKFLKMGTLWCTTGLIITVLFQIFARFFLESAPSWTEEASRSFFIYAISFAAGLALKNHYYVHLDMFYNHLSKKVKKILNLIIPIVIFILFAIITVYAIQLIILGLPERSPSMGLNMGIAFTSILIMAVSICYYAWGQIVKANKNLKR